MTQSAAELDEGYGTLIWSVSDEQTDHWIRVRVTKPGELYLTMQVGKLKYQPQRWQAQVLVPGTIEELQAAFVGVTPSMLESFRVQGELTREEPFRAMRAVFVPTSTAGRWLFEWQVCHWEEGDEENRTVCIDDKVITTIQGVTDKVAFTPV